MHWDKNTLIMNDSCQHSTLNQLRSPQKEEKKKKQYSTTDCALNSILPQTVCPITGSHTPTQDSALVSHKDTHTLSLSVTLSEWQMAELSTPPGLLAQFPVRGRAFTVKNKTSKTAAH